LKDSSYDVVQAALEKLCKTWPADAATYLEATKDVEGMGNGVRIKWLELAYLHNYNKQQSLDDLVWFAGSAWEFRTRNNAFASIKNIGYCDERVVIHLMDAMLNTNSRLASPAAQLAEHFALQTVNKNLFVKYYNSKSWEPWQRDLLKKQLSFL
jgi:aminopeptidase N